MLRHAAFVAALSAAPPVTTVGLAAFLAKKELMLSTPAAGRFDPGVAAAADFSSPTVGRFAVRRGGAKGVFGNSGAAAAAAQEGPDIAARRLLRCCLHPLAEADRPWMARSGAPRTPQSASTSGVGHPERCRGRRARLSPELASRLRAQSGFPSLFGLLRRLLSRRLLSRGPGLF